MAHLVERVEQAWRPELWREVHVLVAVSGGADSMALLRALCDIKRRSGGAGEVLAAHVHHGIHAAADADARWVADEMRDLHVRSTVRRVDVQGESAEQGDGLESAARSLRYAQLRAVAEAWGARFVATAHTADDQVETILHRILRGTGVRGLAGIPQKRRLGPTAVLIRPLLDVTRQEVLEYLSEIGQAYREDPTNRDVSFTRNRVRRELLPLLREAYNPRVDHALLRLGRQADELQEAVDAVVARLASDVASVSPEKIVVDVARLKHQPEPLVREVLRAAWRRAGWPEQQMSDPAWRRLAGAALAGRADRFTLPGDIDVLAATDLTITRRSR